MSVSFLLVMASFVDEFDKLSLSGKSAVELSYSTEKKSSSKKGECDSETDISYLQIQQYTG